MKDPRAICSPDHTQNWNRHTPEEQADRVVISALMRSIKKMNEDVVRLSENNRIYLQTEISRLEDEIASVESHIIETVKNRKIDIFA